MKPHVPFELAVPIGATDHVTGAPHAVATVVEYGDFECPNCKQAQPAVKMLLERFTGRVRFAFRHFHLRRCTRTPSAPRKRPSAPAGRESSGRCTICCSPIRS